MNAKNGAKNKTNEIGSCCQERKILSNYALSDYALSDISHSN